MSASIVRVVPRRSPLVGLRDRGRDMASGRSRSGVRATVAPDRPEAIGASDAELARLDRAWSAERQRDQHLLRLIVAGARSGI